MRWVVKLLLLVWSVTSLQAQEIPGGPTNEKAKKTYAEAVEHVRQRRFDFALDKFKKADKQDGGLCAVCQELIIKYAMDLKDWKAAEAAAGEIIAQAKGNKDAAIAHYRYGVVLLRKGLDKHSDDIFTHAHDELSKALASYANFPDALFADGVVLAQLKQDDAAKARFEEFVQKKSANEMDRKRALRFISRPELARAKMAPAFVVKTADGQQISMDDLTGKVVLLDFWATWCVPCVKALPHMRDIAKKFQGQPLILLSISLDDDQQKWKDFVAKNEMTWPQYYDGGFTGPIATMFGVHAIPHTFTIDADGVLQDEQIGDAAIEGKLKKLLARAREQQGAEKTTPN